MRKARTLMMSVALLTAAPWSAPREGHAASCVSNLLIVIDRSCSMTNKMIDNKTRWDIAVDALNKVMTRYSGKLNFGIGMFPTRGSAEPKCAQVKPLLAPAAGNETQISNLFVSERPGSPCITNIDEGMKQARDEQSLYGTDRRSFALLITDGAQSDCNGGRQAADPLTVSYIKAMYDKKVPTYVVGFDVGTNAGAQASLNKFADAGGLPNSGTNHFYAANNQGELESVLELIANASTGGEVRVCRGVPCPDGRCLTDAAQCVEGYCIEPTPDLGGTGGADLGDDDSGSGSLATGCSCRLSSGASASSHAGAATLGLGMLVFLGLGLRARRRAAA